MGLFRLRVQHIDKISEIRDLVLDGQLGRLGGPEGRRCQAGGANGPKRSQIAAR